MYKHNALNLCHILLYCWLLRLDARVDEAWQACSAEHVDVLVIDFVPVSLNRAVLLTQIL